MSVPVRAWLFAVAMTLAGIVVIGLVGASDPEGWVLVVFEVVSLALTVTVVGLWHRRRRPDSGLGEFLLAVVAFPVLYAGFGLWLRYRAGAEPRDLVLSAVAEALVMGLIVAAIRFRPATRPVGYR